MYLISAYFDEMTERELLRYIERIAQKSGNMFMVDKHVPPHLTVSAVEVRNGELLLPYMERLRECLVRGTISIVSVGALLPYVLYLTPVLNAYLQDLSQQIYAVVSEIPKVRISKYYRPMQWLPHVTLGKTLTKEQMQTAFAVMQEGFVPFHGEIVRIGLAKTNPHADIWTLTL